MLLGSVSSKICKERRAAKKLRKLSQTQENDIPRKERTLCNHKVEKNPQVPMTCKHTTQARFKIIGQINQ